MSSRALRSALGGALLAAVAAAALAAEPGAVGVGASWTSLLPPLLAIAFALVFRQVIPALFLGVWLGAWILRGFDLPGLFGGLLDTTERFALEALADRDHASIILFSMMIGGLVGIVSRNGGMQGVVKLIARWADTPRHASLATAGMGLAIFFDDYANTLVVGNSMRPVADRFRVSREKLAYLVDSTAAPVACLFLVTTWIGYQVGLIDEGLAALGVDDYDAYAVFLASVPYSFYPMLAIFFVFLVAGTGRDFGAMLRAERAARSAAGAAREDPPDQDDAPGEEIIEPFPHRPQRAVNAIVPIGVLLLGVFGGLLHTGWGEGRSAAEIIGAADSYRALLWGTVLAVVAAGLLSLAQRILSVGEIVNAWFRGARAMLVAMIILVLAWSLSGVTEALGTAEFLASRLGESLPPGLLPSLVFVLAAATAFATGTSWGTMGILMPLVLPLTWALTGGIADNAPVVYATIASVLAGAVWGDHCSPISDTTVLSSMASGCNHIEHVRTQLPYALLVGFVSIGLGLLPVGFGAPWWLSLALSLGLLLLVLRVAGERVESP